MNSILDLIRLPFRKDKELYKALHDLTGVWPRDIKHYKLALMHKSMRSRNEKGRPLNNERLEYLGDAMLDAVVGEIVFRHFEGKREGFLTNARSKLVQRETLGRLAEEMGLNQLIQHQDQKRSHNSYMGGNAFEALVGALYLDHGYNAVKFFFEQRILGKYIDLDRMAYKEVNFKSKLLEWAQKNKVKLEFRMKKQEMDRGGSPTFAYQVFLEGVEGEEGKGFSKKESQQLASKATLQRLKKEPQFIDAIFTAKSERTQMEEMPVSVAPDTTEPRKDAFLIKPQDQASDSPSASGDAPRSGDANPRSGDANPRSGDAPRSANKRRGKRRPDGASPATGQQDPDFDLSDVTLDGADREDVIAKAEAAAYQ